MRTYRLFGLNNQDQEPGNWFTMEEVKCNICETDDQEIVLIASDCVDPLRTYQLVKCKKCNLVFVNPRPKTVDIQKYYHNDTYYAYQERIEEGYGANLRSGLKTYLMEWAGGYRLRDHRTNIAKWATLIIERTMRNHMIGVIPSKSRGKLLDVGCGSGNLMSWYEQHDWETTGIEPSPRGALIARARGLKVIESSLEEARLPDDYFDAITMVQVLEHLQDPKGALAKLHRTLMPGGLIMAGVPNFFCLDRRVLKNSWLPLEVPRHLYHFTPKSLQLLFESVGFSITEIRKKTIFRISPSQLRKCFSLAPIFKPLKDTAYVIVSPLIKLFAPQDHSSTFIALYAMKRS